jgi:hypothetical protein
MQVTTTPDSPGNSPLMAWIRDHLAYPHDYCLLWPFARSGSGYGCFAREGKYTYAHRYICELVHGAPPEGYQAAHSCGRGHEGCVNPRHLSWKSPRDNQLERRPRQGRTKLRPEQVEEIRRVATLESPQDTAARFDVSEAAIRQIQSGKTWRQDRRGIRTFTDDEVRTIRSLEGKRTATAIGQDYGVDINVIRRIQQRKSYAYVPDHQASAA